MDHFRLVDAPPEDKHARLLLSTTQPCPFDHDLPLLKFVKNAAQQQFLDSVFLQVLGDIDEAVVAEYWLFTPSAPASPRCDAAISQETTSRILKDFVMLYGSLPNLRSAASEPASFGFLPAGSCRVSRRIPSHIQPHLPQSECPNELTADSFCPYLYLSSVTIHPQLQRNGLGQQMISELQLLTNTPEVQLSL
jgi:ribosomal protein S18 acetylase RimI-like enzyme